MEKLQEDISENLDSLILNNINELFGKIYSDIDNLTEDNIIDTLLFRKSYLDRENNYREASIIGDLEFYSIDELIKELKKYKKEIIFVENNYSCQIENYITKELGLKFIGGNMIYSLSI